MSAETIQRSEVRISEKDRLNGFPVPNGWGRSRVSEHWYPPGGPWHGYVGGDLASGGRTDQEHVGRRHMTITRDGKIVTYVCPICTAVTRGLINGMCSKCDTAREYRPIEEWLGWDDMRIREPKT